MNCNIYFIYFLLCFVATSGYAQLTGMNAEFAGGGARSLAMGGAFIGLADDATATEFNPAGLWNLRRPELAAQVIYTYDERPFAQFISQELILFESKRDEFAIPSFLSYVHPFQHFTLGISEFTNMYFDRSNPHPARINDLFEENGRNHTYGLTIASAPIDKLSLGLTLRYNEFLYHSKSLGLIAQTDTFEDSAYSANAGILWKPRHDFQLGLVYKSTQNIEGRFKGEKIDTKIPDTLGIGMAWIPNDQWRVLIDLDRIWWSKFDAVPKRTDSKSPSIFKIVRDDVWRFHFGTEFYAGTWKKTAFFLRSGYFYEESSLPQIKSVNEVNISFLEDLTSKRDDIHHFSFGIGLARPRYQLDIGIDHTDHNGTDLIASMVVYF